MNNEERPISKIRRIMIVEDNDDINLTFELVLSYSDYRLRVYAFNDSFDALQEFRADFYDLIIIDITMAKINGFEFYDIVRTMDGQVKICLLTTTGKDVIKNVYPKVETFSVLKIPVTNDELINQIEEILEL